MKKKTEVKAIIFDLGNVLVSFDVFKALKRFSGKYKVSFLKLCKHFVGSKEERAYMCGEISTREFYMYATRISKAHVSFKTFKFYWNDIFKAKKDMEKLLKKLSAKYPLYLISNTNDMHFNYIKKEFRVLAYFTKMFPSHEMNCIKPDPEIYKKALKRMKLKPEETVFIDDIKKFVKGAEKIGIKGIHFKNSKQLIKDLKKLNVKA